MTFFELSMPFDQLLYLKSSYSNNLIHFTENAMRTTFEHSRYLITEMLSFERAEMTQTHILNS